MTEEFRDYIIHTRKIPAKEAVCEAYPESLKDELRDYLKENGYQQLYSHQVEMFKTAEAGKNVVITTSTASGKTLAFLLPVLPRRFLRIRWRERFLFTRRRHWQATSIVPCSRRLSFSVTGRYLPGYMMEIRNRQSVRESDRAQILS